MQELASAALKCELCQDDCVVYCKECSFRFCQEVRALSWKCSTPFAKIALNIFVCPQFSLCLCCMAHRSLQHMPIILQLLQDTACMSDYAESDAVDCFRLHVGSVARRGMRRQAR
jgi:hypothetical protein